MKAVRFVVGLLVLVVGSVIQAETDLDDFATIRGNISTLVKNNKIELQKVVEGELLVFGTSLIDSHGNFAFMVPISKPGFYHINYAGYRQKLPLRLYLQAGLELDLEIDETSHRLTGEKLGHNRLVVEWNNRFQVFDKYTRVEKNVTYEDFYPFLESEGLQLGEEFIEKIDTGDPYFDDLMALAVNADIERACYRFFQMPRTKRPERGNYPQVYFDWQRPEKFSDLRLLELGHGLDLMQLYFWFGQMQGERLSPKQALDVAMSGIVPDQLKETYLYAHFSKYKTSKPPMVQYYDMVSSVRQYLTSDRSKALLIDLETEFHSQVGQPGFNFIYEDIDGNPVSFTSFKGKVVYVDVWATWCAPCKEEIPHLKSLEKALHGEDIVFVSISTDTDKNDWQEFVEENDMAGVQLLADNGPNSDFSKTYEVRTIPRFILFDREGKLVDPNVRRPSSPELKRELLELIRR